MIDTCGAGPPGPQNDCAPGGETGGGTKSVNGGEPIDQVLPPKYVNGNSFALRPYQREAVEAAIKGFDEFRRQLIICPTGGGKTLLLAKIAEHYCPGRTLVLAHREELLEQARDKILRATGIIAEIEAAERTASLEAPVVVASVQTLMREHRRRRFAPDHFALIVVDEAHHALAESYQRVLGYFENADVPDLIKRGLANLAEKRGKLEVFVFRGDGE